ncbi:mannose-1-phosphate guanylyltransferase/mannose-6-phosphate isomerase [Rhizobium cremeum]|uniref:mannose-1-phosphate guanylyltransferase/mannose-6-phosphate isomerase n=1 Tax=Rhizobium cremeum TaxID=2813827 RepID=UPI000DDC9A79|nr:mannose-1-phosphate guanylyltransferase/mannose-6-phosphate isomerase [Rhizobium cremeum]MCJ7994012.1 mannose-1-phosphate guanylyltransferase/mannose-6-phosphate isomerase [Rhizobium cremeum]MCJ7999069.1 mannose-1-phosphate guanylyltransferase/mannose-6-phosphate isomerase [Rhizobium cremeum]
MTSKIVPVIMAGGKGTRLWPLSRAAAAKQFIRFIGDKTLFQGTLLRVGDTDLYESAIVITNEEFRFLVAEQARELDAKLSGILLEPEARNTAAAVAAAAVAVADLYGEDAILQILPSDHDIVVDDTYVNCVRAAAKAAKVGKIVTFGITPTEPATGYGYIELGKELGDGAFAVKRFVEKPKAEIAEKMLEAGNFYWNSGMFVFTAKQIVAELEKFAPDVLAAAKASVRAAAKDLDFTRLDKEAFVQSPSISIDYAVMEKTPNTVVVPAAITWSDLGSWDAVWKIGAPDKDGNVVHGNATVVDTRNSLVMSRDSHIAVQGMDGVAVIASEDAVYVGRLDESQKVGDLVKLLASRKETANLTENHPTSFRPWGGYTSVLNGERFQVKRLFVHPGKKLSLQKHHHRAEHWVCVRGAAEVTIDDKVTILHENQSIYIPQGSVHRLANPGKIQLEMIEIQTGSYLGEDDIIRLVDEFGRS